MTDKFKGTLADIVDTQIETLLTRVTSTDEEPDDLDILIKKVDFPVFIKQLSRVGYSQYSHDQALGGRVNGMQVNLVKADRIKIDLHQDFTWRKKYYCDLSLIWKKSVISEIRKISMKEPAPNINAFIIAINTIFEKTYLEKGDWKYLEKNLKVLPIFSSQARKYGWYRTWFGFVKWWKNVKAGDQFPVFLPFKLIFLSYLEKFNFVSLLYYLFFRTRFFLNKTLPYS